MASADDVKAAIATSQARLARVVDGLDAATLEQEPACGVWPVRTVVGHLNDWIEEINVAAEAQLDGRRVAHHPVVDFERYNQEHASYYADVTWAGTWARLEDTLARSVALLERFEPAMLEATMAYPWEDDGTVAGMFQGIADHHDEHSEQLEAWRRQRSGRRVGG
jgi:hypothetical protein